MYIFKIRQAGGMLSPAGAGGVAVGRQMKEPVSAPQGCPNQMRVSRHEDRGRDATMIYMNSVH